MSFVHKIIIDVIFCVLVCVLVCVPLCDQLGKEYDRLPSQKIERFDCSIAYLCCEEGFEIAAVYRPESLFLPTNDKKSDGSVLAYAIHCRIQRSSTRLIIRRRLLHTRIGSDKVHCAM